MDNTKTTQDVFTKMRSKKKLKERVVGINKEFIKFTEYADSGKSIIDPTIYHPKMPERQKYDVFVKLLAETEATKRIEKITQKIYDKIKKGDTYEEIYNDDSFKELYNINARGITLLRNGLGLAEAIATDELADKFEASGGIDEANKIRAIGFTHYQCNEMLKDPETSIKVKQQILQERIEQAGGKAGTKKIEQPMVNVTDTLNIVKIKDKD